MRGTRLGGVATVFFKKVFKNRDEAVVLSLLKGVAPVDTGWTPLSLAAAGGLVDSVELLL